MTRTVRGWAAAAVLALVATVGAFGPSSVGAAVPSSETVWVTAGELCAQTQAAVAASPRYVAANGAQRKLADAQVKSTCALLPKSSFRAGSARCDCRSTGQASTLVRGGWLTPTQSSMLETLAAQLDDVRPISVISGPTSATVGVPAALSGLQSRDADGSVVGYAWSFGDSSAGACGVAPNGCASSFRPRGRTSSSCASRTTTPSQ